MYLSVLQRLSSFPPLLASSLVPHNCMMTVPAPADFVASRTVQKDSHVFKLCQRVLLQTEQHATDIAKQDVNRL